MKMAATALDEARMISQAHRHTRPNPARPWWEWCCPACTPKLYESLTIPTAAERLATHAECAFCLHNIPTPVGTFRRHKDDERPCRGNGLTPTAARELVEKAATWRMTTPRLRDIQITTRAIPPRGAPDTRVADMVERLCAALGDQRVEIGRTQRWVAARVNTRDTTVSNWERAQQIPEPYRLIQWAHAVHTHICIKSPDGISTPLYTSHDAGPILREARNDLGETLEQTAVRIEYSTFAGPVGARSLSAWEHAARAPRITHLLAAWCVALDHTLTIQG